MMLLHPGWIKMVIFQVGIAAALNGTAEPNLAPELAANVCERCSRNLLRHIGYV